MSMVQDGLHRIWQNGWQKPTFKGRLQKRNLDPGYSSIQ